MPGQKSLTFPAPEGDSGRWCRKILVFCANLQICGLITLLLDIVCLARGVSGGVSLPFLAKIRHFHSHFRLTFCGQLWGIWGGTSKKGQKWPKMVKNGQKWSKMAKNGLFGGSLGKPPPPPFLRFKSCLKTPVFAKRAIFQDFWIGGVGGGGRFWPKMAILGVFEVEINFEFKSDQNLGSQKWPEMVKMGISGGFPGGVENDHF